MARPELGTKRVCPTTGRKFYDLNRDPIVSPYTGEALPRTLFEPQPRGIAARAPARDEEEDDVEVVAGGPEVISLEEVETAEEAGAEGVVADEVAADEDVGTEDAFLEEEEGSGDVSDLIDGEIEDDEES